MTPVESFKFESNLTGKPLKYDKDPKKERSDEIIIDISENPTLLDFIDLIKKEFPSELKQSLILKPAVKGSIIVKRK